MRTMTRKISLTINGKPYTHDVEPRLLLIHYLREIAGLTGPHIGNFADLFERSAGRRHVALEQRPDASVRERLTLVGLRRAAASR